MNIMTIEEIKELFQKFLDENFLNAKWEEFLEQEGYTIEDLNMEDK